MENLKKKGLKYSGEKTNFGWWYCYSPCYYSFRGFSGKKLIKKLPNYSGAVFLFYIPFSSKYIKKYSWRSPLTFFPLQNNSKGSVCPSKVAIPSKYPKISLTVSLITILKKDLKASLPSSSSLLYKACPFFQLGSLYGARSLPSSNNCMYLSSSFSKITDGVLKSMIQFHVCP